MGNPVQVTVDEGDKEMLERAAARHGITLQEYLKRAAAGTLRPIPAWQAPQPHLPTASGTNHPPRTFQETMDSMMERMMMMNMMRSMPGLFQDAAVGTKPLTVEDVERLLDARTKRGDADGGNDSMMSMFREAYRMKMLTKAMSGMEEDAPPALRKEMQETRERFEKAQAELLGQLKSKDAEIRRKEEDEKDEKRAAQVEGLRQESLAAIQKLEQQVLQMRGTGNPPPKGEIDQLTDGLARLETVRGKLDTLFGGKDPKAGRPWWLDDLKEMINTAGDNVGKVLEGYGAVEAGRRGLPPPGQMPGGPPGTQPVYTPDYIDDDAAPPRPSATKDPYPMLAGYATEPGDLSTWPDIPYSEADNNGQVRTLSKPDFVSRYGTHIYGQRKAAGVLPAPTPPPSIATAEAFPDVAPVPALPPIATAAPPPSPHVPAAPREPPSVLSALSGGAPLEPATTAPLPAPTPEPTPASTPEPAEEPEIPPGVLGHQTTSLPTSVDLDGNVLDGETG